MTRWSSSKGSVLILSLWIMLFLSLFVWAMARRASLEARLSGYFMEDLDFEALARGQALASYRKIRKEDNGGPTSFQSPWLDEHLSDEERRVNVNVLDLVSLTRLFGGDKDVAAAIVDWRDPDDKTTPGGAETGYYKTRSPYTCRNAPFQFPEELYLVKGMTRELYEQAMPHLTLWGDGRVNWNTASPRILEVMGLPGEDSRAIADFRLGPDRLAGTGDDRVMSEAAGLIARVDKEAPLTTKGKEVLETLLLRNRFCFRGRRVRWEGSLQAEGTPAPRRVTLVLSPWDQSAPILLWREGL